MLLLGKTQFSTLFRPHFGAVRLLAFAIVLNVIECIAYNHEFPLELDLLHLNCKLK